ncbi:MAG: intein-containing recombinase RecA, partial [Methylococcaceae bacterium]
PPFRTADFDILYGEGVSYEGELVDLGVQYEVVQKSGSWYSFSGDKIGQGKDNVRNYLKEHPDMAAIIDQKIREKAFTGAAAVGSQDAASKTDKSSKAEVIEDLGF